MKLDKSYSEDIKKDITAAQADFLYQGGQIFSKYRFQCPSDNCSAPVTCANLDKAKDKRKRDPYYKVVGEHSISCDIGADEQKVIGRNSGYSDIYSNTDEYFDHAVRLNLQVSSARRPDLAAGDDLDDDDTERGKSTESDKGGKRKIQRSKTLSSMIDAFLNNEQLVVQLPDIGLIDINDLFVEIDGQDISELDDEFRIYYGKAWVNKRDTGYSFNFANKLSYEGEEASPSTFLPIAKIEESNFKRFRLSTLDKLADKYPKNVFLLSQTAPRPNGIYINIWCDGPECIDCRII